MPYSKVGWRDLSRLLFTAKANKPLGLLKRYCPLMLTKVAVRRSLYLAIVYPHLCCATEVWSPALKSLKLKIERVQRRATSMKTDFTLKASSDVVQR